jgi:putative peptidoglycan lipid II flippase
MTWFERPSAAPRPGTGEPYAAEEATVLLPVVPVDLPTETTMMLPTLVPFDLDHTQILAPVPARPVPARSNAAVGAFPARATGVAQVPPAAGPPEQAPPGSDQPSVARSSAIMAAGSLVSRVTGLARTVAIGAAIGAAGVGNAYGLSNNLPNMVYELLLGGVLGSVLVPFLTRARIRDRDRGQAYAQRLMTLSLVFLAGATVVAVVAAPLLTQLFALTQKNPAPTTDQLHLTTTLSYLILPEIFFYGIAALGAAILNTRGHFAAPTWTPILNNIVVIATAIAFILMPGAHPVTLFNISTNQILVLGIGTTLGIIVQALGLLPALRGVGFRWKLRFDWRELQLGELGRAGGWMLSYVISSQLALIIALQIMTSVGAKRLPDGSTAPGIAIYNSAYLIFMMAHGICAVSIMVAMMPRLSAAATEGRLEDLAAQMSKGTRLSAVILIPITAAYLTLGQPLAVTVFSWRSYTHEQATQTGTVIALAAIGLVPYAISQMQLFALYAMRKQRSASLINLPVAAARIGIDLLFYAVLPFAVVTASLMVANTISYLLALTVGYAVLRRLLGRLGLMEMFTALARLALAAAIAAVPTYLLVLFFRHEIGTGKGASIITLVAGGLVLVVIYVGAALALKAKDVTDVAAMVKGRLGR